MAAVAVASHVAWRGHRQVVVIMVVALLSSLPPIRLSSCPITVGIVVMWCERRDVSSIDLEEINLDEVLSKLNTSSWLSGRVHDAKI